MAKFSEKKFKAMFESIHRFQDYIYDDSGEYNLKDMKQDAEFADISKYLDLAVVPMLKNIKHGGENFDQVDYFTSKEDGILKARGVIHISQDWCDIGNPMHYYEIGHIEEKDNVSDYVKEIHLDAIVMDVYSKLDTKKPISEKGSEVGRELIRGAIEGSDIAPNLKNKIKYSCIVETNDLNIWKVGFHESSYQLLFTGESCIYNLNNEVFVTAYINGLKFKDPQKLEPMTKDQIADAVLHDYNDNWFDFGVVDLDPEQTKQNLIEEELVRKKTLAAEVYTSIMERKYTDVGPISLDTALWVYEPKDIASIAISVAGEKDGADFWKLFVGRCSEKYPDKLKEASRIIENTYQKLKV